MVSSNQIDVQNGIYYIIYKPNTLYNNLIYYVILGAYLTCYQFGGKYPDTLCKNIFQII